MLQFKTSLPRHLPATDAAPASLHRFKYDTAGRLVEANSPEARIEFAYDPAGQRVSETQTHDDHWSYTLAHTYTPLGVLQSSAYPDAPPVQWLSYGSGHLHGVEIGGAAVLAFERDALHREIERQTDGLICHTIRDALGRPAQQRMSPRQSPPDTPVWARDNQYDPLGQLRQVEDSVNGLHTYTYDLSGRLVASRHGQTERSYAFDAAGNRLGASASEALSGNRLTEFEGIDLSYDGAGNLSEKKLPDGTRLHFGYDALNRMVSLERLNPDGSTLRARYAYDVFNVSVRPQPS